MPTLPDDAVICDRHLRSGVRRCSAELLRLAQQAQDQPTGQVRPAPAPAGGGADREPVVRGLCAPHHPRSCAAATQ